MANQSIIIRVLLDSESKEDVYRDIKIGASASLQQLSDGILKAFNFSGEEAASFIRVTKKWDVIVNEDYDSMSDTDLPTLEIQQEMFVDDPKSPHMGNTKVSEIFKTIGSNILYTYDLLKNWRFLLVANEILNEKTDTPQVVLINGDAPAEESKEIDFNFDNLAKNERGATRDFDDDEDDDEFQDGWMDEYETDDY